MRSKSMNPEDYDGALHGIVGMPKEYPSGYHVGLHAHKRSQLIYATSGVMELMTERGLWFLPPQRALWMPGGIAHEMRARSDVSLRTLYVSDQACPEHFPKKPRSIHVSILLRELILRVAGIPLERKPTEHEKCILDLLPHEVVWEADGVLHLPTPKDKRLANLCQTLIANPGDIRSLEDWSNFVGTLTRTLARLFKSEFGCTFILWRKQLRVLSAVPRLAAGEQIGIVAADMGYETPSAFTAIFRQIMGEMPSRYFDRDISGNIDDTNLILSDLA